MDFQASLPYTRLLLNGRKPVSPAFPDDRPAARVFSIFPTVEVAEHVSLASHHARFQQVSSRFLKLHQKLRPENDVQALPGTRPSEVNCEGRRQQRVVRQ